MDKLKVIEQEFSKLKEEYPIEFSKTENILRDIEISNDTKLLLIELEISNKEFCLKFLKTFYQNLYYMVTDSKYFDLVNKKYTNFSQFFN